MKPEKIRTIMRNHDPKFNDFPKFKLDSEIQRGQPQAESSTAAAGQN